ncbi:hypothetical protein [Micromonospora sp. NBC_01796]|uniref:hypothetical protein n=1 Tax=Micromonospora sp. NBC_01796 TaxID=2975987 RepID=UPI002DD8D4A7|nr:hypothetical protein [Micromonospora sp. NBC_01796]WSA83810.1 hypothetical protein OIE47_25995 [Micromonospora sp. NBC_01796]
MSDQLVLAVATVLATKGAEALVSGGRTAVGALLRLIRTRFGKDTDESAALTAVVTCPDDRARQMELASALARTMSEDPEFDAAVRAQWQLVETAMFATQGDVSNRFAGQADVVVQARDIHGDVRF